MRVQLLAEDDALSAILLDLRFRLAIKTTEQVLEAAEAGGLVFAGKRCTQPEIVLFERDTNMRCACGRVMLSVGGVAGA